MTIKPFCVMSKDITDSELNLMLEKCIELGSNICDWVSGCEGVMDFGYEKDQYKYWGVNFDRETFGHGNLYYYNYNLLTKERAFEMLGIAAKGE